MGADQNQEDENEMTALDYASWGGHVETVESLLAHAIHTNPGERYIMTAHHCAWYGQHKSIVQILYNHEYDIVHHGID